MELEIAVTMGGVKELQELKFLLKLLNQKLKLKKKRTGGTSSLTFQIKKKTRPMMISLIGMTLLVKILYFLEIFVNQVVLKLDLVLIEETIVLKIMNVDQ
jgi:hypothetical protein